MHFLYFDPGLGAMIAQAAIAIAAGVALFSKTVMYKIKSMLGLHKEEDKDFYNTIDEVEDKETENKNADPKH